MSDAAAMGLALKTMHRKSIHRKNHMCLSTPAILAFISLLPPDIITPSKEQIIIRAEAGEVVWTFGAPYWCLGADDRVRAGEDA